MKIIKAISYFKSHWESRRELQKNNWKLGEANPRDVRFLADAFVKHAIKNIRKAKKNEDFENFDD